jgi:hypothetical protein
MEITVFAVGKKNELKNFEYIADEVLKGKTCI